jgi:hypothetical protein
MAVRDFANKKTFVSNGAEEPMRNAYLAAIYSEVRAR